jgi:hypothetical protein
MSLTKKQVAEIVAFDWKRRTGGDFDGRRYGSITGSNAPRMTEDWTECYGVNPQDKRNGIERKKVCRKTLRYNYIIPAKTRNAKTRDVTVVHVAVRLDQYYVPVVKDVVRFHTATGLTEMRDIDYKGIAGWCVYWDSADYRGKKPTSRAITPRLAKGGKWCVFMAGKTPEKWHFARGYHFPYHETINVAALQNTRFQYCQYADEGTGLTGLIDWLMLYRQEPRVEHLAKAGWYGLITPTGIQALKDRKVFDWMREHQKEASEEIRVQYLVWAARHGKSLKTAVDFFNFKRLFTHNLWAINHAIARRWHDEHPDEPRPRKNRLRIDWWRLYSTWSKWKIDVTEYINYLQAAVDAGLDWRNEGTLYPPTKGGRDAFMDRYERLEAQVATEESKRAIRKAKAERKRLKALFAERMPEIEMFQKSLERVKTLEGCGYRLILAKTQEELLAEGNKMNNCVGNGVYGRGILEGDTLIVMLKSADGKSYCDIEIERNRWRVRQCYLKGNQLPPDEVRKLAKRIAAELKKIYKLSKKRKAA